MENNQINTKSDTTSKYNPLKDAGFWIAFIFAGVPSIIFVISYYRALRMYNLLVVPLT